LLHKLIRILVAAGSSDIRETIKDGICVHRATRYIEVDIATNGRAALDSLQKKPVDIAFIDIDMPGLDGPAVVAAMRETKSSHCLAVVMATALDPGEEAVFKRLGAYHFLQKPFHQDQISGIVSTFMKMETVYPILIVDDSAVTRKLARKVLENSRFHFEIFEADSAQAALKLLATEKFRIVLTDFQMPGGDGIELAGIIRGHFSKIGIYMMSTDVTTYLERSAAFVGISGFLKKPFAPEDIDALMHRFLELDAPKFGKMRDMFSFSAREKKAS